MMQAFIAPLAELAEYQEILQKRRKEKGILQIAGCVNSQKTHLMYALGDGFSYKIIVFSSEEKAQKAYEEYRFLDSGVLYYPARDLLFYHADIKGNYLMKQRMEVIRSMVTRQKNQEITVITTMDAFLDGLSPAEEIVSKRIQISSGDTVDFTKLQERLSGLGYAREVQIEGPGQFAVRGGLLDIFPLTEEIPVRVELWGDEVDSIRTFDVESQRSIENLQKIEIYPAAELQSQKKQSFLEYFPTEESILFLDEPQRLIEKANEIEEEFQESVRKREEAGLEETQELTVYPVLEILNRINQFYVAQGCADFLAQRGIPAVRNSRRRGEAGGGNTGVQPQVVALPRLLAQAVGPVRQPDLRDAVFGHTPRFEGFRTGKQRAFFFQGQFFQQKFCILHMVFPSHKKSRIQRLQADIRRGFHSASTVRFYQGQWTLTLPPA